jgi:hypothetical protein
MRPISMTAYSSDIVFAPLLVRSHRHPSIQRLLPWPPARWAVRCCRRVGKILNLNRRRHHEKSGKSSHLRMGGLNADFCVLMRCLSHRRRPSAVSILKPRGKDAAAPRRSDQVSHEMIRLLRCDQDPFSLGGVRSSKRSLLR